MKTIPELLESELPSDQVILALLDEEQLDEDWKSVVAGLAMTAFSLLAPNASQAQTATPVSDKDKPGMVQHTQKDTVLQIGSDVAVIRQKGNRLFLAVYTPKGADVNLNRLKLQNTAATAVAQFLNNIHGFTSASVPGVEGLKYPVAPVEFDNGSGHKTVYSQGIFTAPLPSK